MNNKITVKAATAIMGSLGFPSKMPGTSYGIPATACNVGRKLHAVPDTVCSDCYALKANYQYPSVIVGQERRLAGIVHPRWVEVMVATILRSHGMDEHGAVSPKIIDAGGVGWHRWHDAGDIQNLEHLVKIVAVCRATPKISHWLPTREVQVVKEYMRLHGAFPANLCVRVSATKINGAPPQNLGLPGSSVYDGAPIRARAVGCPAYTQDGKCGPCRNCWDNTVEEVAYPRH
jgi:hypothetical protein